jgi:hypothetical protein
VYPQACRENKAQTKILFVVYYQQGMFNLVVLEPKGPTVHFPADYKATQMKMKLGDIHQWTWLSYTRKPMICFIEECF